MNIRHDFATGQPATASECTLRLGNNADDSIGSARTLDGILPVSDNDAAVEFADRNTFEIDLHLGTKGLGNSNICHRHGKRGGNCDDEAIGE